ncbi:hypothetical protein D3C87_1601390 [compost metagenome]
MDGGAHRGLRSRGQRGGDGVDQRGVDQRLVALHVDDDRVTVESELFAGFGQPVGAAGVVLAGEQRLDAVRLAGVDDGSVIAGHHHAKGAGLAGTLRHAHDHRQAGDVGQRFVGKSRRSQPGRHQNGEAHRPSSSSDSVRASFSSSTGMPSRTG